jgi:hypothetical protein
MLIHILVDIAVNGPVTRAVDDLQNIAKIALLRDD